MTTTTTTPPADRPADRPRKPHPLRVRSGIKAGGNDDPHAAF